MIKIVDYGMGNLRSVQKALERQGAAAEICESPAELADAEKMILPGVGAFRDAIAELRNREFVDPIRDHIDAGKPFLGICLGLQLLFDVGYEEGEWEGLGIVPGKVVKFEDLPESNGERLCIPHMGWNQLQRSETNSPDVLAGVPADAWFYFVHSYYVVPDDESVVAAHTEHGRPFVSVIARENLFASQFHPEKSQTHGMKLLANFAAL